MEEGGTAQFLVTLSRTSTRAVTVDYATADGTAQQSSDYAAASGTLRFAPGEASKTIPIPLLNIIDDTVEEGEQAQFTITLSRISTQTVTVDYATADGTAQQGSDYTAAAGTIQFAPGEASKTIPVPTIEDTVEEQTETSPSPSLTPAAPPSRTEPPPAPSPTTTDPSPPSHC